MENVAGCGFKISLAALVCEIRLWNFDAFTVNFFLEGNEKPFYFMSVTGIGTDIFYTVTTERSFHRFYVTTHLFLIIVTV